jgi:hypothetical protein
VHAAVTGPRWLADWDPSLTRPLNSLPLCCSLRPPAADKYSFANGTGSSKKLKRRNSVGRAVRGRRQ